ncbi:MAG: Shikimate kinase [Promethearchaeota archaeon]|nr:MAG: Shikimate kinase [Candidatus Lokiarchaeota archaeon]
MKRLTTIVLIGMPASGKSTIGRLLAERLKYKFIDTDEYIEEREQKSLQEILDTEGIEIFCQIEEKRLLELLPCSQHVIAPGGSIIYSKKVMHIFQKISLIVFLNLSLDILQSRLRNKQARGIVGLKTHTLQSIFEERLPLYIKYAHITVQCDGKAPNNITEEIIKHIDAARQK